MLTTTRFDFITEQCSLSESVLRGGVLSLDLLVSVVLVELHELGEIELGLLEDLDLLDEDVLEGENLRALLRDLLRDVIREPDSYIIY